MKKNRMKALSLDSEYNMLMTSLRVSVSKHLLNDSFTVIWANDFYYEMTGYTKEEYDTIFHSNCAEYFANDMDEYQKISDAVMNALNNHESGYDQICRMPQKGGGYIWIRFVGTFTEEVYEGYPVIYVVYTDVNELIQSQLEREITYEKLPGFVAKFQIQEKDHYELLEANDRFHEFFGENVDTRKIFIESKETKSLMMKNYKRMMAKQPVHFQTRSCSQHGDEAWFQISAEYFDTLQGKPIYLFVFIDITQQKKTEEEKERLAFVDPITDGYNRARFELAMDEVLSDTSEPAYSFVSLNVEKFKLINDMFGIGKGDQVLRHIYTICRSFLDTDEVLSRFAADQFVLLLKTVNHSVLQDRLQEMVMAINAFNNELDTKYFLVFHAGVYIIEDPALEFATCLDRANMAKKEFQKTPDNQLLSMSIYSIKNRVRLMKEKDIENRMEHALQNDEFSIYLQPKVKVDSEEVVGAEALVRWMDPAYGMIYPNDFIPIFEKNGFIIKLDLCVFEKVCQMLRRWLDEGRKPITISINMSRAHIANENFLDPYEIIRNRYDIPVQYLEFEVTETMIFENPELLKNVIQKLHQAGYTCSMDDFGSGYSSLNLLKDMEFDVMKLDRAFFHLDDKEDIREQEIIRSVIDLANKLHMKSVAEGVETRHQVEFLKSTACTMIQGYVYAKPMPIKEFETLKFE